MASIRKSYRCSNILLSNAAAFRPSNFPIRSITTTKSRKDGEHALAAQPLLAMTATSSPSLTTTPTPTSRPLARMPTKTLLRGYLLGQIFARPALMSLGINLMQKISHSKSLLLNPDRNWILEKFIRYSVFNHFCAGSNKREVRGTVIGLKKQGFSGVILCYAKELAPEELKESKPDAGLTEKHVGKWAEGNGRTLEMLGRGDYMAIKYAYYPHYYHSRNHY